MLPDGCDARCSAGPNNGGLDVLHEAIISCERCARFDVLVGLMHPPHLAKPKKWNQKNPEDKLVVAHIRLDSTILHFPLNAK
jgi:hypothetical protein